MPNDSRALVFISVCLIILAAAAFRFTGGDDSDQSSVSAQIAAAEREAIERVQPSETSSPTGQSDEVKLQAGDQAPDFALKGVRADGTKDEISLSDYAGKPLVIEFIATWCPHCRAMAPRFADVMNQNPDVGYLVIGSADEPKKKVREWHESFLSAPMPGDLAYDNDLQTLRAYGGVGYPTIAFINSEGEIVSVISGEITEEDLQDKVESLGGGSD